MTAVPRAGGYRRRPRRRDRSGGHRVGSHPLPVRRSAGDDALAGRRLEPGRRALAGARRGQQRSRRLHRSKARRRWPSYYLLPSVKARLLADIGDHAGAAASYREALSQPCTEPERRFLIRRLRASDPTYP